MPFVLKQRVPLSSIPTLSNKREAPSEQKPTLPFYGQSNPQQAAEIQACHTPPQKRSRKSLIRSDSRNDVHDPSSIFERIRLENRTQNSPRKVSDEDMATELPAMWTAFQRATVTVAHQNKIIIQEPNE